METSQTNNVLQVSIVLLAVALNLLVNVIPIKLNNPIDTMIAKELYII